MAGAAAYSNEKKDTDLIRNFITLFLASVCFVNIAYSQSKNQDRQDEKRENERVEKMQKAVREAQDELQKIAKSLRTSIIETQRAEAALRLALSDFRHERETAEDRWEEKNGLADQIQSMRDLRAKYDSIVKPMIAQVQTSDEWIVATKNASAAITASKTILNDDSLSEDQLEAHLAKRDAIINAPRELETKAVEADPEAKSLKIKIDAQLESIKSKRSKLDDEKIENDPQVKQAKAASQKAQQLVDTAKKELASLRSQVSKKQTSLAHANKNLSDAKQADANDRNQSTKAKKKK